LLGTGVTCPSYRYRPQIVAEAFASLGLLYPGRVFLGVGAGEALNEVPGGGGWGSYQERAARLGGVTHIFIHSPQADQARVIRFYGEQVLPRLSTKPLAGSRR
jgi:hypothetical protein